MIDLVFSYVLPIISFFMAAFFFVKFWKFRDILDGETIRLIRQVKTMWGTRQGAKGNASMATSKNYKAGSQKVGKRIKELVPFGLLDELNDDEVHAYIMNEDTINFFLKAKELFGGEWKLPGMPELPNIERGTRRRNQDDIPKM